jgi:hypothetical protein
MKSTFTISLFLLAGLGVFAQRDITGAEVRALAPLPTATNKVTTVDTITTYLDRATAYYLLSAGSSGYVLGTSSVTSETAVHYDALGTTVVTEVMIYFADKEVMSTADSLIANVYAAGLDSMPLVNIGSGKFSVDDIDTSGFPIFVPVAASATVGDFCVSVQYAGGTIDDSVAIMSTNPVAQGGGPDGNGEKRCRQLTTLGWLRAAEIWTIAGNPYDADALIVPIVDFTAVGVNGHVGKAGLNLYPSFPNPASDLHNIVISTDVTEDITIVVYDRMGRTVATETYAQLGAGKHTLSLATDNWAAGTYFFMVSNGRASLASKFAVQH